MPSLKAIRTRIVSVKNTQKITKAMKLVAAARLRRATQRITELRPYANKVQEVLATVAAAPPESEPGKETKLHPLLEVHPEKKNAILVIITSDRGLAGAYNSNVLRAAERRSRELREAGYEAVRAVTVGRKAHESFRSKENVSLLRNVENAFVGGGDAKAITETARMLIDEYTESRTDLVEVVYTEFRSAIAQMVRTQQILPVPQNEPAAGDKDVAASEAGGGAPKDLVYEPNREALLERLLPMYVEVSLLRALLDSVASEHGARMTAMDNATKNAKEMINSLTLIYNRARQASITKELMEIIGGAEALKG